jgi:hypothetical protein
MEVKMRKFESSSFLIFLFVFSSVFSYSQKIENVKFKQEESKIIITYDLINGDASKYFEVSIEMSSDGGSDFSSTVKTVSGDVGENIQPGKGKKITWDVLKDVTELSGSNFVFKILATGTGSTETVKAESSSGGIPTWVWIGGGAVIVGGAAAILLSSKKTETPETPDLPDNSKITWPPK